MRRKDQQRYQREYEELSGGFVDTQSNGFMPAGGLEPSGGFTSDDSFAHNREQRMEAQRRAAERQRRYDLYLKEQAKERRRTRWRRAILIVLSILLLAAAAGFILWRSFAKPPVVKAEAPELINAKGGDVTREDESYTLLIAGKDKAAGLTDTILLGKFDAKNHTAHFYSIPRDTCVNEDWQTKKVNQYYTTAGGGEDGVQAMLDGTEKLLGFRVDYYMIIDLEAFIEIVDTIGGVEFDVPVDMDYDDPWQDLSIHVKKGPQKLDGLSAMGVWRFRATYAMGDIDRLNVQHDLLKAVVKQTLTLGNITNLDKIIDIVTKRVETDLTAGNLAYFAEQFLKMDEENVTFETAPGNYSGMMNNLSYVFLYPDQWLACINQYINPYSVDISLEDLDVVYETGNGFASTSGTLAKNFP